MTQFAIVTDLNQCVGCLACMTACKTENSVPIGNFWTKMLRIGPNPAYEGAQNPDVELYFLPVGCQHCVQPQCVSVCPTGASQKLEDGTVQIDKQKCIGCQFCVMACPYNVRYLNAEEKVVEKCTLCEQKTAEGELPQCVTQCGARAKFFGDIDAGIDSLECPGDYLALGNDHSYNATKNTRYVLGERVKSYSNSDVYRLPDVGNAPSFAYILRNYKWQGNA